MSIFKADKPLYRVCNSKWGTADIYILLGVWVEAIGDPVFDKIDARLSQACISNIGAHNVPLSTL
jgi:hypothetical protein